MSIEKDFDDHYLKMLKPGDKVKHNEKTYFLKEVNHEGNSAPMGMLWLCEEHNQIAHGVINTITKTPYWGSDLQIIHVLDDKDNLRLLYRLYFPEEFEKKTFWQKLKALFS